jgi:hypothetical protein
VSKSKKQGKKEKRAHHLRAAVVLSALAVRAHPAGLSGLKSNAVSGLDVLYVRTDLDHDSSSFVAEDLRERQVSVLRE